MITKTMSIEEIAKRLDTPIERLSKCTTEELATLVEHYNNYAKAKRRYECDRILYFLDEDRPKKN